ncbi:MAG: c-type cytochrome [Planctomycetes bacterium]|nr:c-type cytochrome [Planctomycetota bacterium]
MHKPFWLALVVLQAGFVNGADELPKSLDPRLTVELFAEHPQIVTPTGLDVDYRGRVFAIESNTHFPPEDYKGHPTDRVLVMSDSDNDGRADRIVVFTDGLTHSMSVLVRPLWFPVLKTASHAAPQQSVYIATRKEIRLFHDDNGDDVADRNDRIVFLETTGNYPHNGLAGFALDGLGWMYFGFGENLGAAYKIIGSDGTTLSGTDAGNIYRCRLDGSRLSQFATGFWNPHANTFDAFGHLFSVDNDPDSRPPCRLNHIIPDGDSGYRFRNGRKGLHPFTSWNGEVPGTLPMVAGTGEAPSGILAYESDGLPAEYIGNLLVTSWGDHRIDRFRLQPQGTSFTSLAEPLITGGENFRPVGVATAPDGSLYFTDWVLRDYKLHGHGRIWRIRSTAARTTPVVDLATITAMESLDVTSLKPLVDSPRRDVRRMAAHHLANATAATPRGQLELVWSRRAKAIDAGAPVTDALADFVDTLPNLIADGDKPPFAAGSRKIRKNVRELLGEMLSSDRKPRQPDHDLLLPLLATETLVPEGDLVKLVCSVDDPFLHSILVTMLSRQFKQDDFARYLTPGSNASVPSRLAMLLAARKQNPKEDRLLRVALNDHDPDVRRVAVQWVAEEKLNDLRPRVEAVLSSSGMTAELFLATLAALQMLDGGNPADFDKTPPETYVVPLLKDSQRPAPVRAQALRLIAPTDKVFDVALLESLVKAEDSVLRLEAIRTLQGANPEISAGLLREIVADEKRDLVERAEAVVGLAALVKSESPGGPTRQQIAQLLSPTSKPQLQREALRATRGLLAEDSQLKSAVNTLAESVKGVTDESLAIELADQIALSYADSKLEPPTSIAGLVSVRPRTNAEWLAQLNRGRDVDAGAGRRTFYHPQGAGCFKCHRIDGRGGRVGPDLSRAVGTMNRVQLIQSILEPSREIAPQYVAWAFAMHDGKVVTGMIVHENEGKTVVGNSEGQTVELKTADIAERVPQRISVMPEKLTDRMTLQELRDLIAFLDAQR